MAGIPSKSWAFYHSTTKIQRSSKPLFTVKVSIQRVSLPNAPLWVFFFFSFREEEICLPRMQKSNAEVISRVSYSFGKIRFGKQEPIYRNSYSARVTRMEDGNGKMEKASHSLIYSHAFSQVYAHESENGRTSKSKGAAITIYKLALV